MKHPYDDIWNYLNTGLEDPAVMVQFPDTFNSEECNNHFADSTCTIMKSKSLSASDRHILKISGIEYGYIDANREAIDSDKFLERIQLYQRHRPLLNKIIQKTKQTIDRKKANHTNKEKIEHIKISTRFQDIMLQKGFLESVCPFSGKIIASNKSLFFDVYDWRTMVFYRFAGKETYYLITSTLANAFQKLCIYIPRFEIIYLLNESFAYDITQGINDFKASMVCKWKTVERYINNTKKNNRSVALITSKHFAHHLWNELTGINRIVENRLFSKVNGFLIANQPIAPITKIFPEIDSKNTIDLTGKSSDYIIKEIYDKNYFIIRFGGNYITESLAKRVHNAALEICSPEVIETAHNARINNDLIIWFSIRTDFRVWINQIEGISNIINKLAIEHPKIGIIFDGFSTPNECHDKSFMLDLKKEQERQKSVMNKIQNKLSTGIKTYDKIGVAVAESIVWSYITDFYVCNHGSIQHKIGWIANKPGVIHTNKKSALSGKRHQTYWARENAYQPEIVYDDTNEGYEVNIYDGDLRKNLFNYDCNWLILYNVIVKGIA